MSFFSADRTAACSTIGYHSNSWASCNILAVAWLDFGGDFIVVEDR